MTDVTPITPTALGIVAGGLALVAIYWLAGSRYLGPDDNFWSPIRRWLLPRLDTLLHQYGGYATNDATREEYVGRLELHPETLGVQPGVETYLSRADYLWNAAAGLKTDPQGRTEHSSWAKRKFRHPRLRQVFDSLEDVRVLGCRVELLEAFLAPRQTHATLFYNEETGITTVFGHEEPNALNPLMFVAHYRGGGQTLLGDRVPGVRTEMGVAEIAEDLLEQGAPLDLSATALEVAPHLEGGARP